MVENLTTGGRLTAEFSAELALFLRPIYWGCFGLFFIRFEVGFQASISYLSKCLSPLFLEPNTSISKGEFFESVLQKC